MSIPKDIQHLDLTQRKLASDAGQSMYVSPRQCAKCGTYKRFTNGGKCVECNRINCHRRQSTPERIARLEARSVRRAEKETRSASAKQRSIARQSAIANGDKTYHGKPCSKGHGSLRYTSGGCVECASIASKSDAKKAYDKQYYAENSTRIVARTRVYMRLNKDKIVAANKNWAKANPEKIRSIKQSYKARRRAQEAQGDDTRTIHAWRMAAAKVCHWCGVDCAGGYHVDHVIPLSKGGAHKVDNLVISCAPCNLKKNAKMPTEFLREIGMI